MQNVDTGQADTARNTDFRAMSGPISAFDMSACLGFTVLAASEEERAEAIQDYSSLHIFFTR
ncbi:hypothetical protein MKX08_000112 [Trichoderma sp. CBMAI-0020]|nr:hypothetical protein MKX08_000112 [Trichoderma sp. CBMAI-0020]